MPAPRKPPAKPSTLLALVALGILLRIRPAWSAIPLGKAASVEGQSAERISRLIGRALPLFEQVLSTLVQRGRPARARELDATACELGLTQELLAVTTGILAQVSLRKSAIRQLIVGAWQRLSSKLTQERFCAALALSPRTLRFWLKQGRTAGAPTTVQNAPAEPKPRRKTKLRPPRRRRFGFDTLLPDTQIGADTTDLSAFGVPLKWIAAQDIGGRDTDLFDAIVVDKEENSELVIHVLKETLANHPGAQVITDQGTPYMSARTREAIAALSAEHAPQKEGDPLGKSTVERAFGTLKSIASPLLCITDQLADAVPALRNGVLAQAATHLILAALLRAYQCGARAARAALKDRGTLDETVLAQLAAQSRDAARATERSARLLLTHIHTLYEFTSSLNQFVDSLRIYPVSVLREAERALQSQMHRSDIRDRAVYFAAIVRKLAAEHRLRRMREERHRQEDRQGSAALASRDARNAGWAKDPAAHLLTALEALAAQWLPERRVLLFDGVGLGLGWLRRALGNLLALHGPVITTDIVAGVLHTFRLTHSGRLGTDGFAAIDAIVGREVKALSNPQTPWQHSTPATIIYRAGKQRPPPGTRLRN